MTNDRPVQARDTISAEEVEKLASAFVRDFNNLEWESFRNYFADDATLFFPFPDQAFRAEGRVEIEKSFKAYFDQTRKESPGPPYLDIQPKDIKIQLLGNGAILTFHLYENSRRTIVFDRRDGELKIIHLHASSAQGR